MSCSPSSSRDSCAAESAAPCVHCGIPVTTRVGGEPVCDDCYTVRGACCQEFDGNDLSSSNADE